VSRLESLRLSLPLVELTCPEKSWRDWLVAALIFGISLLHFSCFYNYTLLNADEGIVLQGAQRILQGQVLYRDFFSLLTPGSYYWMAFFFKVFGSSILVGRAVLIGEGASLSVLTYLLSRRVCSRWTAFLASIFVTLIGLPTRFLVLHNWDSTLWVCLTLYCAVLFLQYPRRLLLFATGWFAALTCLFEHSKGAGLVLGLGLASIVLLTTDRVTLKYWRPGFLVPLVLGFAVPVIFTFVYFSAHHTLSQMLEDWSWPLRNYSAVNKTPYGFVVLSPEDRAAIYNEPWPSRLVTIVLTGPWFIVPALPFVAAAVFMFWLQRRWRAKSNQRARRAYFVLISATVIGLLLSLFATGRPDFHHLVYISPVLFVVLAWIMDGQMLPFLVRRGLPLLTFLLFISCVGFGLSLLSQPLNAGYVLQTRRGTLKAVHADEVIGYIQAHVPGGQKILVYPYLPLYYYLTETFSPGRYEYLQPGLHTPEQVHALVKELDADQTRLVFFEPYFREKAPTAFPSTPAETRNERDPVADYIRSHYRECATLNSQDFWHFRAMVRKDLPCPAE